MFNNKINQIKVLLNSLLRLAFLVTLLCLASTGKSWAGYNEFHSLPTGSKICTGGYYKATKNGPSGCISYSDGYHYFINGVRVIPGDYSSAVEHAATYEPYYITSTTGLSCRRNHKTDEVTCYSDGIISKTYLKHGSPVSGTDFYNSMALEAEAVKEENELKAFRMLAGHQVQSYINGSLHKLQWVGNGAYLYDRINYFYEETPIDGFPQFVSRLASTNPTALYDVLPQPLPKVWVPVAADITFFIQADQNPNISRSQRRVGTSSVDIHLLREQLRKLTKRSWLTGKSNFEQHVQELYNNGASYRNSSNTLKIGAPLSQAQQWAVPKDMLWPEYRSINGASVLVPVLYLTQSTYKTNAVSTALVQAGDIALEYDSFTVDGGDIVARRSLLLTALNGIEIDQGGVTSGGDLWLQAGGTLSNLSGVISGDNVKLVANDFLSETVVVRNDYANGYNSQASDLAVVSALGDLTIESSNDIIALGSQFSAQGDIKFIAPYGTIALFPSQVSQYFSDSGTGPDKFEWSLSSSATTQIQTQLSGANITLLAGETIQISGGIIESEGDIQLLAGMGIYIIDAQNTSSSSYSFSSESGGTFGSEESLDEQSQKTDIVRTLITAGNDIALKTVNGDVTLKGIDLTAGGALQVDAENGAIHLQLAIGRDYYSYKRTSTGLLIFSNSGHGHDIETATYNELNAQGGIVFNASTGIFVEYTGDSLSLEENLDVLAAQPNMAWINQVRNHPDVDWSQITLANENWDYKTRGLTEVAAALLQIAVMAMTGGLDITSMLADGLVNSAIEAAVTAATSTLMTQAGHALVANGFDISATLDSLASQDSIKSLLQNMATASVMSGLSGLTNDLFNIPPATAEAWDLSEGFTTYSNQALNALQQATINVAVHGGSLEDGIKTQIASSIVTSLSAWGAGEIGDVATESILDNNNRLMTEGVRLLSHAALGCAIGKVDGNDCDSGALGAVSGEVLGMLAGDYIDPDGLLSNEDRRAKIHNFSMVGTILIADLADKNVSIAQQTGSNAVLNNFLKHEQQVAFAEERNACLIFVDVTARADCEKPVLAKYLDLSDVNNDELKVAFSACEADNFGVNSLNCFDYVKLVKTGLHFTESTFSYPNVLSDFTLPGQVYSDAQLENTLASLRGQENYSVFDSLIKRQLGEEIVLLPGTNQATHPGPAELGPEQYVSVIEAKHDELIAEGAEILLYAAADTAVGGPVGKLAGYLLKPVGTLIINGSGRVIGVVRESADGLRKVVWGRDRTGNKVVDSFTGGKVVRVIDRKDNIVPNITAKDIASKEPIHLTDNKIIDNQGFVYSKNPDGSLKSEMATASEIQQSGIQIDYKNISTAKPNMVPPQSKVARNQNEQLAFDHVAVNPQNGDGLSLDSDARFDGFKKMQQNVPGPSGKNISIHYQYDPSTGRVFDMKVISSITHAQ